MLRSLEEKGVITFDSLEPRGPQYARRFRPALSREEYYVKLAQEEGGVNMNLFSQTAFAAFLKERARKNKEEMYKRLEEIIEKFEAEGEDEEEGGDGET